MGDRGRQSEEGTLGWENPWGLQGPGCMSRTSKGGQLDEGRQSHASMKNSLWPPRKGGKRRRAVEASGWGSRPGGWLLWAWESWGREVGTKRE